ncbi:hypothetical protein ACE6H2_009630 [Prunus campanulata]
MHHPSQTHSVLSQATRPSSFPHHQPVCPDRDRSDGNGNSNSDLTSWLNTLNQWSYKSRRELRPR